MSKLDRIKKFYEDNKLPIVVGGMVVGVYTATILVSAKVAGLEAAKVTANAIAKMPKPDETALATEVGVQIAQHVLPAIKDGMADFASEALSTVRQQVQQVPSYTTPMFRA